MQKEHLLEEAFEAESKVQQGNQVLIAMKVSQCWPSPYLKYCRKIHLIFTKILESTLLMRNLIALRRNLQSSHITDQL